jgi:hypothetical protein
MEFATAKAAFRRDPSDQTAGVYQSIARDYEARGDISPLTIARMQADIEDYRAGREEVARADERRKAMGAAWRATKLA